MRYLPLVLFAVALACLGFAYWGLETPAGRQCFDEMAGIIPMATGVAGIVFLSAAAATGSYRWLRERNEVDC